MSKNLVYNLVGYVGVVLAAFMGFQIATSTKNLSTGHANFGASLTKSSVSRDPAAIRKNYDFSGLAGDALSQASKQRLASGAIVRKSDSDVGVGLGDFVISSNDGQKAFACQKYGTVELSFEGDGSAINGQKPEMQVEGSCEVASDINSISPLWIPVAKILGEPVADGEFDFREQHPVRVRFANVSGVWPTTWRLKGVRMIDPKHPGDEVKVSDEDLADLLDRPLILSFTN